MPPANELVVLLIVKINVLYPVVIVEIPLNDTSLELLILLLLSVCVKT
jgi:hypothetical protein